MNLSTAEQWATIIGNGAIIIALLIALFQLRAIRTDRTVQLMVEMRRWLDELDPDIVKLSTFNRAGGKINIGAPEDPHTVAFRRVSNFLELLGALIGSRVFDPKIAEAAFGQPLFQRHYERFKEPVDILRDGNPETYKWLVQIATDP